MNRRTIHRGGTARTRLELALAVGLASVLAACSSDPSSLSSAARLATVGQCQRDEEVLFNPEPYGCAIDESCACGSFCSQASHTCAFDCLPDAPVNDPLACPAGEVCDDAGRCVDAASVPPPPSHAPQLAVAPAAVGVADGAAANVEVRLRLAAGFTGADRSAAEESEVRVAASEGFSLGCGGAERAGECTFDAWTFGFDGADLVASRAVTVRREPGSPDEGQVTVHLATADETATIAVVRAAAGGSDAAFTGVVTSPAIDTPIAVTAVRRGAVLVVRDALHMVSAHGVIVLDVLPDDTAAGTVRRTTWLSAPGGAEGQALPADYVAIAPLVADDSGALATAFELRYPASGDAVTWQLALVPAGDAVAECASDTDCGAGWRCPASLAVCVPSEDLTAPSGALESTLEDPRSDLWWNAVLPWIGTGTEASAAAFQTDGAHFVERLLCSTAAATIGNLGAIVLQGSNSRSGDLACANDTWSTIDGAGAAGLVTRSDRNLDANALTMLEACLADLSKTPPASIWSELSSVSGTCANLARFYPALRAMATAENDKVTGLGFDRRVDGMFLRLVQQWLQVHGFVASQATSVAEYGPETETAEGDVRAELEQVIDRVNEGWTALLDHRVAGELPRNGTTDFRIAKRPAAYWTFDDGRLDDEIAGRALVGGGAGACGHSTTSSMLSQGYDCPGYRSELPGLSTGNMTVSFYARPSYAEFPPYVGGTIVATPTMAIVYNPIDASNLTLGIAHPVEGGGVEWVGFKWVYDLQDSTYVAIVRDAAAMTYTAHVYDHAPCGSCPPRSFSATQRYYQRVGGTLPTGSLQSYEPPNRRELVGEPRSLVPRTSTAVLVGAGWFPAKRSFVGQLDDVAIWNTALSAAEFKRFAVARGDNQVGRTAWPYDTVIADNDTEEYGSPLAAIEREADASRLGLVARYLELMRAQVDLACQLDDADAKAAVAAALDRAGLTMRQSLALDGLLAPTSLPSDAVLRARLEDDAELVRARRGAVARLAAALSRCTSPYGLTDNEVPLYFALPDEPSANQAFFAASDYLRGLAAQRVDEAAANFNLFASRWDAARQSQLQEALTSDQRDRRIAELAQRYGEPMRRLCGLEDMTSEEVLAGFTDGTLSVNDCFVRETNACRNGNFLEPIRDADPGCYRGQIGASILDVSAAQHGFLGAYSRWQAAAADAASAARLCVLKEIDEFGCSAADRQHLEGISCPPGYQGTQQLAADYNDYMTRHERASGLITNLVATATRIGAVIGAAAASGGVGGAFVAFAVGNMDFIVTDLGNSMSERKRQYEEMLRHRAAVDAIRSCWAQAEQYERAISGAEESAKEALARLQSGTMAVDNGLGELRSQALEGPIVVERERTRTVVPVAFHYWVSESLEDYRFSMDVAKRYTYLALRAAEYDTQQSFRESSLTRPSTQAILASQRPGKLRQQLTLLDNHTNTRDAWGRDPSQKFTVIDLGKDVLGLGFPSTVGGELIKRTRAVYDRNGTYVGQGIRFTFLPDDDAPTPTYRCAERLWHANIGAAGGIGSISGPVELKLYQRNLFASRMCDDNGLQVASLRPEVNLFIATGETGSYTPAAQSRSAGINVSRLDSAGVVEAFLNQDGYRDGSSAELAGAGLYGDYVLIIPKPTINQGVNLSAISQLLLRFDYVSVDNSPIVDLRARGRVTVDAATTPLVVE
jgi:hypothetical protein